VKDFMCHQNQHVDFSKRLNFLVGHNGSECKCIIGC
jgi:recombinational DNA repair ATPase RecF